MADDPKYLHVASFVKVVWYDKAKYPKGIKTYEVKTGDEEVESEPKKKSPAEE